MSRQLQTICFGEGLDTVSLKAYKTNWNDLTITFEGSDDKVTIEGYFISEDNRKFNTVFADGTSFNYADCNNPIKHVIATQGDDWINSWSDDGIWLNGDLGNDTLYGGLGDDVLVGGYGCDSLFGGAGDDVYKFSKGYGSDIVNDTEGVNVIIFEDICREEAAFSVSYLENPPALIVTLAETGETITIKDYNQDNYIFEFSDGTKGMVQITDDYAEYVPDVG